MLVLDSLEAKKQVEIMFVSKLLLVLTLLLFDQEFNLAIRNGYKKHSRRQNVEF